MFQPLTFAHVWFMSQGLLVTFQLVGLALTGGLAGSVIVTALLLSRFILLRWIANIFVYLIQGTPIIVVLFMSHYGLPKIGIHVPPATAMILAFGIFTSAFMGEIWRSSLRAVPKGQWDASRTLGLTPMTILVLVILPQAIRIAIPPSIGFVVQLVKATSVVAIIGVSELTRAAQIVSNATFKPLPVFLIAAAFYFAINFPLTLLSRHLEARAAK